MPNPNARGPQADVVVDPKSTFSAYDKADVQERVVTNTGRGFAALPPECEERKAKGDLGNSVIKDFESRPLSTQGTPWKNLRGGK